MFRSIKLKLLIPNILYAGQLSIVIILTYFREELFFGERNFVLSVTLNCVRPKTGSALSFLKVPLNAIHSIFFLNKTNFNCY